MVDCPSVCTSILTVSSCFLSDEISEGQEGTVAVRPKKRRGKAKADDFRTKQGKPVRREVDEPANFFRTTKGNPALKDSQGYHYIKDNVAKSSDTIYWRCRHKKAKHKTGVSEKCYVNITTTGFRITHIRGEHNHPPVQYLEDPEILVVKPKGESSGHDTNVESPE